MSKTITIVSNHLDSKVMNADEDDKRIMVELLSYYVTGYENISSYKSGKWDGRSTMYNWETDMFPNGFRGLVSERLSDLGYKVTLLDQKRPTALYGVPKSLGSFAWSEKYSYQWDMVDRLLKVGVMTARLSTGAGKTFAASLAAKTIGRKTLILTKRSVLFHQFYDALKVNGIYAGRVNARYKETEPLVIVGQVQSIIAAINNGDTEVVKMLGEVEFLIGEEAHEISDDRYYNICRMCKNASYRLGLTGTPFMKSSDVNNMRLLGFFGAVGITVSEKHLIDKGINAKPYFKFIDYQPSKKVRYGTGYQKAIAEQICYGTDRNYQIELMLNKAIEHDMTSLVLVQREEHLKILRMMGEKNRHKFHCISGKSSDDERNKALDDLKRGIVSYVVATSIVDVGVDVPMVGLLIIAGGGKAEDTYRQRIGRALRPKPTGPNICFVADFYDAHNEHLYNHYQERIGTLKKVDGFNEGILDEEEDLPWELFKK